jgi:hypothetical protein
MFFLRRIDLSSHSLSQHTSDFWFDKGVEEYPKEIVHKNGEV